jgi:hypothetical protein
MGTHEIVRQVFVRGFAQDKHSKASLLSQRESYLAYLLHQGLSIGISGGLPGILSFECHPYDRSDTTEKGWARRDRERKLTLIQGWTPDC